MTLSAQSSEVMTTQTSYACATAASTQLRLLAVSTQPTSRQQRACAALGPSHPVPSSFPIGPPQSAGAGSARRAAFQLCRDWRARSAHACSHLPARGALRAIRRSRPGHVWRVRRRRGVTGGLRYRAYLREEEPEREGGGWGEPGLRLRPTPPGTPRGSRCHHEGVREPGAPERGGGEKVGQ